MKNKPYIVLFIALVCLLAASGCATTKTDRGVTIEKQRSSNPFDYIPFF
ncbi:MAG: hypothetical protein R6U56_03670 [Opitutales bacterium]